MARTKRPAAPANRPGQAGGYLPGSGDDGGAAARQARRRMKRRRALDKLFGRIAAVVVLGAVAAVGYYGYQLYQDDQADEAVAREDRASGQDVRNAAGAIGPLGDQASPADVSSILGIDDLLPDAFLDTANRLDDSGRFAVFVVNDNLFSTSHPSEYLAWVGRLEAQTQQPITSPRFALMPDALRGQIVVGVRTDGSTVFEAVVLSREPDLRVILGS